jgi:hypothetical protein
MFPYLSQNERAPLIKETKDVYVYTSFEET